MAKTKNKSKLFSLDFRQLKLMRLRRSSSTTNTSLRPSRESLIYLKKFFFKEKKLVLSAIIFIALQTVLEVGLVIISRRYLQGFSDTTWFIPLILVVSLVYIISSYWAVRLEKTTIVTLINALRARWFRIFLSRKLGPGFLEEKSGLIAKISYHLPLLSTGLSNSLFGAWRMIALAFALFSVCLFFGFKFLLVFLVVILIAVFVAVSGFFIARNFIAQETTFYSQIIRLVDQSLSDWRFTRFFRRQKSTFKDFNRLVDFDSYFRIRRDLWLRFSSVFIFVAIILFSLLINSRPSYFANLYSETSASLKFALAVLAVYSSRIIYEALRAGLYSVPLSLGLFLSVPTSGPAPWSGEKDLVFSQLSFRSAKVKFFQPDKYHTDIFLNFQPGGRYLICGGSRSGKTSLAKIITGQADYGRRAWQIKLDGRRYFYNEFFSKYHGFYYIDPKFSTNRNILEVALGKEKERITNEDFLRLTDRINSEPALAGVFFEGADWRRDASQISGDSKSSLILQVLYCLESKPRLVAIDNHWLDGNDPEIEAIISALERNLSSSAIVRFSKDKKISGGQIIYEI